VLIAALLPVSALAQYTYRCTTVDGKKYYGATIPQQCLGQPIEQLSPSGTVMRRIDPEGDERARQAKEAEAAKKREEEVVLKEQSRRNRALLATYASEKDINEARVRALAENQKAIKEVEVRIAEIRKRQARYDKEMEFYTEGVAKSDAKKKAGASAPAPKGAKPPPKLLDDIKNAEVDLKAQENLLTVKQKEVDGINAKYDEDLRRYLELTGKDASARGKALGMDKGVTVQSKPAASSLEQQRNQMDAQRRATQERNELERIEREHEMARRRSTR
jgi:hypothetical protein